MGLANNVLLQEEDPFRLFGALLGRRNQMPSLSSIFDRDPAEEGKLALSKFLSKNV